MEPLFLLDPMIEGYLSYLLEVRRLSPRTIIDMRCTFNGVLRASAELFPGKELFKLTFEEFVRWIEWEREQGGRSTASLNKELSHLRGFLDYVWRSGRSDRNVLDGFTLQDIKTREEPMVLSVEEARQLISACGRSTQEERQQRVMILLLYGCGLRTHELCGLDVSDVDKEQQEIFVRKGKGGIQRRIPVPGSVWTELLSYLVERSGKRGPLFMTQYKGARISNNDVSYVVRKAAAKAGLKEGVVPKTLRHSFSTHLQSQGVDLAIIASLMGHKTIRETNPYLHTLPGKRESAVKRLEELSTDEPKDKE